MGKRGLVVFNVLEHVQQHHRIERSIRQRAACQIELQQRHAAHGARQCFERRPDIVGAQDGAMGESVAQQGEHKTGGAAHFQDDGRIRGEPAPQPAHRVKPGGQVYIVVPARSAFLKRSQFVGPAGLTHLIGKHGGLAVSHAEAATGPDRLLRVAGGWRKRHGESGGRVIGGERQWSPRRE